MKPIILLVRPQLPENIGMVERAMVNCGFDELRLVAPRDEFPSPEQMATSAGAHDLLRVQVFNNLPSAIADVHLVVATSVRNREQAINFYPPNDSYNIMLEKIKTKARVAVMFGPERTGLANDDLCHAHHALTFPTNPSFPSLNLAGSVLLFCYLWNQVAHQLPAIVPSPAFDEPATAAERDYFIDRLLTSLADKDFFKSPAMRPALTRNIRQMLTRADFSSQEIRTWHGILTALLDKLADSP